MRQNIADLKENDLVDCIFLVREKKLHSFKTKMGQYLTLTLADSSGQMEAVAWDEAESLERAIDAGTPTAVTGLVIRYRGQLQIQVEGLRKAAAEEIREAALDLHRPYQESMECELTELLSSISPGPLADLARAFVQAPFYRDFCYAPAAQAYHHNFAGGLLEHSLGVARIVLKLVEIHPDLDRDLILLGAILHDMGKIKEMQDDGSIYYTDEGKLLGHIILGIQMLEHLMEGVHTDRVTRNKLLHLIASHHGQYEWQSPKKPQFLEAKVLHLADMLDAEIWKFKSARPVPGSDWSPYIKSIGSEVFLG